MATELISGVKEFNASIKALENRMRMAGRDIVIEGGQVIVKNSRRMFTEPGNGRKGKHVGPPGGPPNIRSGNLARSIQSSKAEEIGRGRWTNRTGPTAIYGRRIERGFPEGKHNYPYLQPGFEKSMPEIKIIAERVWAGVLRA